MNACILVKISQEENEDMGRDETLPELIVCCLIFLACHVLQCASFETCIFVCIVAVTSTFVVVKMGWFVMWSTRRLSCLDNPFCLW